MEGHWLPMEYMLHLFLAPGLKYSTIKYELLTVLLELKRWCYYLLGFLFIVHLDYASLQWLLS